MNSADVISSAAWILFNDSKRFPCSYLSLTASNLIRQELGHDLSKWLSPVSNNPSDPISDKIPLNDIASNEFSNTENVYKLNCELCDVSFDTIEDMNEHQDFHFAMKLQQQENQSHNLIERNLSKKIPKTKQKVKITNFFQPY